MPKLNSYYSYGSSAFNLDAMEKMHKEQSIKAEKKKQIAHKKNQRKVLSIITIAFILAFTVLYRNALIIQKSDTTDKLQAELTHLQSQNAQTEMKLKEKVNLQYVEEMATTKLGMKRPDKYQTVYVNVVQNDYAEISEEYKTKNYYKGALSTVNRGSFNLLEYLK